MNDKALYLLAQFDDATNDALEDHYTALTRHGFVGQQTKGIPYHFTLGSRDVSREEELTKKLGEICAATPSFGIRLSHFGLFGTRVLFVAPNANIELLNLQRNFFSDCGHGDHDWAAHATILIDERAEILRAWPILADAFVPISARIESVALYEFFPARLIRKCSLINS